MTALETREGRPPAGTPSISQKLSHEHEQRSAPAGTPRAPRLFEMNVTNEAEAERELFLAVGTGALAGMFLRGDQVVYTPRVGAEGYRPPHREGDDDGPAQVQILDAHRLAARVSHAFRCVRVRGKDKRPALFPVAAARTVLLVAEDAPNLRRLRGVIHTPVPRADGSLIRSHGFDRKTGLLYLPTVEVPEVPEQPSAAEVEEAVALLRGLLAGFDWAGKHDEANFLGLLLTPLLRELAPGPYPLGAIMARQPGSGKSLLAAVLREVHGGVFRSEVPGDDAELGKSLTSILTMTTGPVVTWDNVSGTLRSSRLAGLLTSREYTDRPLGATAHVAATNDRLWTITGNNLNLGGDLVRRAVWVTIDPQVPDPHRRTGFAIPDLVAHVRAHRGAILRALLVLIAAWSAAGRPAARCESDSYATWRSIVRGILEHAEVPGAFDHDESKAQAVGADDEGWGEFLAAIREVYGDTPWTVAELLKRVDNPLQGPPVSSEALPTELHEKLLRAGSPQALSKSLGAWLRNRDGRFAGDLVCRAGAPTRNKVRTWRVAKAGEPS